MKEEGYEKGMFIKTAKSETLKRKFQMGKKIGNFQANRI